MTYRNPMFDEPHYTLSQIAKMWGISPATALRLFRDADGVLRIGNTNSRKRTKISLRVPKSVAEREHAKLTGQNHSV